MSPRGDASRVDAGYLLGELIGRGGMAEVYAGFAIGAHGIQKPVAIKRLLPQLATNASFVDRLIGEANLLVGMQRGNIVVSPPSEPSEPSAPHRRAVVATRPSPEALLRVDTAEGRWARITIGKQFRDSPGARFRLAPGRYTIKVSNDEVDFTCQVALGADRMTRVVVSLTDSACR